jgi:hypothetical protein
MEIGSANYEKNGFKRREFFKIKDGEQVYRILPPLGSMAKLGKWARYMRVEWGYADLTGKKKPFQDVREVNRKTGMVEVESEAHIKREALKKQHEAGKAAFKAGKISKDQLDQLNKIVMNFSLENKHYLNVIDKNGKIGILKIGHKLKLALDSEIASLRSKGVDPLSVDNGRFFVITRSGYGLDTTFGVKVYSELITHAELGQVERPVIHKLDAGIIGRLATEAMDLADLDKLYPSITSEEVKRVVLGTPSDVSEVFARFAKQAEAAAPVEGDGPEDEGYSQIAAPVATAAPAAEVTLTTTTAVGQNVTLGTQPAPAEKIQVQSSPAQLSDDDFLAGLASLGIKS